MKVLIQKQILIDLKLELHSRNKIKQIDYYVYFVSLLNNLRVKHRGDEQVDSIVRLNSSKMKKVYYNYSLFKTYKILVLLIKFQIIVQI